MIYDSKPFKSRLRKSKVAQENNLKKEGDRETEIGMDEVDVNESEDKLGFAQMQHLLNRIKATRTHAHGTVEVAPSLLQHWGHGLKS